MAYVEACPICGKSNDLYFYDVRDNVILAFCSYCENVVIPLKTPQYLEVMLEDEE